MCARARPSGVPLVSVVIPAFNAARFLAETIDSVLAQDHPALEVVVVDDGSTDATGEIARSYGDAVAVLTQVHQGLGAAQNRGIARATGDYLSFLDADDLWRPQKTRLQVAAIESLPDIDIVFAHVEQFSSAPAEGGAAPTIPETRQVVPGYSTGTMLLARSTFDRVGRFSTAVTIGPFLEWYMRAEDLGIRAHMMQEVLMHRRVHQHNMGIRLRHQQGDYLRVLKESIDRRRAVGRHGEREH